MARTTLAAAVLVVLAASLVACGDDANAPDGTDGSTSPTSQPSEQPGEPTSESTAPADPGTGPLDWQSTGHSPEDRVVRAAAWTAVATENAVTFEPTGDGEPVVVPAVEGRSVDAVLLEGDAAVVSFAAGGETPSGAAVRVDLATGTKTGIVSPEPANGGSWAMHDDSLWYPTLGEGGAYCLATLAVSDGNGEDGWCAPERTGFSNLTAGEHGVGLMTFDDTRPVACRTVHVLDQAGEPQPVDGPTECTAWDVAPTSTGVIWSEVPREQRQEVARFSASVDGEVQALGKGTTGTLVPCGGDAFFVRDPARRTDPARLMRWDGAALSVVYESESTGNAFLGEPECADGIVTLSSFGEAGDEQVWAEVG
ncbi:hypothetical protein [Nocardioides sp. Soil805]|uniref:hypothetical protein n=1 Tax=Nocardioides sp. Soil805 TaxID=1736416 RepID=UPI00070346B4|nr:hypothetical protein [Nocardioides sp. Soil805]KRF34848.1 hypothetical protein ASG94_11835 [Nocardioides sp. Soil805]